MSRIVCGDTLYEIDGAYREGAEAMRRLVPWHCNPHREGSRACGQWSTGHENEAAGEHVRFGVDVVAAGSPPGAVWEEDPAAPRDAQGRVDPDWYGAALAAARRHSPASRACGS